MIKGKVFKECNLQLKKVFILWGLPAFMVEHLDRENERTIAELVASLKKLH